MTRPCWPTRPASPRRWNSLLRGIIARKPDYHHALNALGFSLADRGVRLQEAQDADREGPGIRTRRPLHHRQPGLGGISPGNRKEALEPFWKRAYRAARTWRSPPTWAKCCGAWASATLARKPSGARVCASSPRTTDALGHAPAPGSAAETLRAVSERLQRWLLLAALGAALLGGLRPAAPPCQRPADHWSGRLALQIEDASAQSFSAGFEPGRSRCGSADPVQPAGQHHRRAAMDAWTRAMAQQWRRATAIRLAADPGAGADGQRTAHRRAVWLARGRTSAGCRLAGGLERTGQGRLTATRHQPARRRMLRVILIPTNTCPPHASLYDVPAPAKLNLFLHITGGGPMATTCCNRCSCSSTGATRCISICARTAASRAKDLEPQPCRLTI